MEKVEKKLTRFRATLKNKRKLSLPVFINQFQQQWAEQHGGGGGGGGSGGLGDSVGGGSLTSIPPAVDREGRRGLSPTGLNLSFTPLEVGRERGHSIGGSPYSTLSRTGAPCPYPCHINLITSVSSPGGTTQLVPGTPPFPMVHLCFPGEYRPNVTLYTDF